MSSAPMDKKSSICYTENVEFYKFILKSVYRNIPYMMIMFKKGNFPHFGGVNHIFYRTETEPQI